MSLNLQTLSLAELTAVYNKHSAKSIKKFTCSKADAIKRVEAVLPAKRKGHSASKPGPRTGVCATMTALFSDGKTPAEVFAAVHKKHPACHTSLKAAYWYRAWLRRQGVAV